MSWINGNKTYLLAAAAVVYGIAGYITGNLDLNQAMGIVGAALGASTLRHGISTGK